MPLTQVCTAGNPDRMRLYRSQDPIFKGENAASRLARRTGPNNECAIAIHIPWDPERRDNYDSFSNVADHLVCALYQGLPQNVRTRRRRSMYPTEFLEFSDVCRGVRRDRGMKSQEHRLLNGNLVTRLSSDDLSKGIAEASADALMENHYWLNHAGIRVGARAVPAAVSVVGGLASEAPVLGLVAGGVVLFTPLMDKLVIEPYATTAEKRYKREIVKDNPQQAIDMVGKQFGRWRRNTESHRKKRDALFKCAVEGYVMPMSAKGPSIVYRCRDYNQAEDFMQTTLELVNGNPGDYTPFF